MTESNEAKKIFISHHHSQARELSEFKEEVEKAGFKAFLAHEDITPGEHDLERIEKELKECDVLLYICSKESNASAYCQQEIGFAKAMEKKIIITMIDGTPPEGFIARQQAVKCKNFDSVLTNVFEYLPVDEDIKKHLKILDVKGFSKEKKEGYIYLEGIVWNDFGYRTSIDLILDNEKIQSISTAFDGQGKGEYSLDELPQTFTHLDNRFFSNVFNTWELTDEKLISLEFLIKSFSGLDIEERIKIHQNNSQILKYSLYRDETEKLNRLVTKTPNAQKYRGIKMIGSKWGHKSDGYKKLFDTSDECAEHFNT